MDKTAQLKAMMELLAASATKQEVTDAFAALIKFVKTLKESNAQEITLMKSAISMLGEKMKEDVGSDMSGAKQEMMAYCEKEMSTMMKGMKKMEKEQMDGMKFIYDKVAGLEDGHTPTRDELLALILPLIPQVENGKDAEVDVDAIVEQVLAKIPKPTFGGSRAGWGAHPLAIQSSTATVEKVARNIKFTGATVTRSPDGVVTVAVGGGTAVYDEVVAGATNTFTLANTPTAGTVRVYANGQRLLPTTDYTISGAIITTVLAWSAGQVSSDYSY